MKIKNTLARKKSMFSVLTTLIIIAVLVLVNVLATVATDRLHLTADLTLDKEFTISQINIDYLKEVKRDVSVTFLATESEYAGSYYSNYVSAYENASDDTGKYFSQTVEIAKKYSTYNDKITVDFVDVQSNEFSAIRQNYPTENFTYGDILVESSFLNKQGTTTKRHKIISFSSIYSLSDETGMAAQGYGAYTVSGNNIETQLTSAIHYVTSDETFKAAYFDTHCEEKILQEKLIPTLELNNYETAAISDAVITSASIPEDTDVLIMACVTTDFTTEELEVIDNWLDNDGNKGRGLVFYASTSSPNLANLYKYLEEWGISVGSGILYETEDSLVLEQNSNMMIANLATDYTADINSKQGYYVVDNMVPMEIVFENYENREAHSLMTTSDTVVIAPVGADISTWKPTADNIEKARSAAILAVDTNYAGDTVEGVSSYVIAFSSTDFAYSNLIESNQVLNLDMSVSAVNTASGAGKAAITFTQKSITNEMITEITTASVRVMTAIFVIAIPVLIIAACIFVYLRRKSR